MADVDLMQLGWIALSLFLLAMSKGGFPIGSIALPLLVFVWPDQTQAARASVAFMLPMLCVMDIVALCLYARHVQWPLIRPLLGGSLAGVLVGSLLFVSDESALLALSDRMLTFLIGLLGLLFVLYRIARRWLLQHLETVHPTTLVASGFGLAAGITSTLAHAAGPVMQMYLLPQHLPKAQFAATTVAFFFLLNLVKMIPFTLAGRIQTEGLLLGVTLLPVIPLGVLAGFALVRITREKHYTALIYTALTVASSGLILKALNSL